MSPKTRNIIGWVLTALLLALFLFSASGKIIGMASMQKVSEKIGISMEGFRILGIIELLSVILFAIPRTGLLGTLLLTAYMGGAVATHLEHAEPFYAQCMFIAIIWITALIRFPEMGSRLLGTGDKNDPKDFSIS